MSDSIHRQGALSYPPKIDRATPRYPIATICRCDICESFRKDPKKALNGVLDQLYELGNLMDT